MLGALSVILKLQVDTQTRGCEDSHRSSIAHNMLFHRFRVNCARSPDWSAYLVWSEVDMEIRLVTDLQVFLAS